MRIVSPFFLRLLLVTFPAIGRCGCQSDNHQTLRDVLDCTVSLSESGDTNEACRTFVVSYDKFVKTGKIEGFPLPDKERFFFEGGDQLATYAEHVKTRDARLSAAGRAELFFRAYVDWFSALSKGELKQLPNSGRVRSVTRYLGNTLLAEDRKSDIPNYYFFMYMSTGASVFGPEAVTLWEQSLKDTYGVWNEAKNASNPEWSEYAAFLQDWADVPGMLRASLQEHYRQHSEQILGKRL